MRQLIDSFPREVAKPYRRLCHTESEFYSYINRHNGKVDLFYSVYKIDANGKFENINLNKIPYDFDNIDSIEDVKKLHNHLKESNIKHLLLFSGKKGFHVYVFTINYEQLKSPKNTLYNAQNYFIKLLNINPDPKIIGDTARIMRIPNTKHISGNKYCIPLTSSDLDKGIEHIRNKAENQNFEFKYYGNKLLDISAFDTEIEKKSYAFNMPDYIYNIPINDVMVKKFYPCIQHWLLNINEMGTYEARFQFAVFCRDMGLSPETCDKFAQKYFGTIKRKDNFKSNYIHFKRVKALKYAYEKEGFCWNCDTMFLHEICPGKCKDYCKDNFPLYKKKISYEGI